MLSKQKNLYASEVSRQDHEEADILICLHVLHAISKGDVICNVTIYSPHTDVFNLLLHLFARNGITGELIFKTGKSKLERKISINERCKCTGTSKAMGLAGLHMFLGLIGEANSSEFQRSNESNRTLLCH